MTFDPSPQQLAIRDLLLSSSPPNLTIEAVAGSGKTTTITWLCGLLPVRLPNALLPQQICFLAFNKAIADTLRTKLPSHVQSSTFHSLGLRALKPALPHSFKVEGRKVGKLVFQHLDRNDPDLQSTIKLVGLMKAVGFEHLPGAPDCRGIADRFDMELADPSNVFRVAEKVFRMSNENLTEIDFDDMLWLPVLLGCSFTPMDWVFVDEAQDTNDIQSEILFRLASTKQVPYLLNTPWQQYSDTKYVFVGDPRQAIYGFRGANSDAMDRIAKRFACQSLPLSVSYRCPKKVVDEARKYLGVPQPQDLIEQHLHKTIRSGDMETLDYDSAVSDYCGEQEI